MINLVHKQNGDIYDRFLSGELTLKKAREEFMALSRLLILYRVQPVVVGVIEELGKAWAELAEREYIESQRTRSKDVVKKRINIDTTASESLFLYK